MRAFMRLYISVRLPELSAFLTIALLTIALLQKLAFVGEPDQYSPAPGSGRRHVAGAPFPIPGAP